MHGRRRLGDGHGHGRGAAGSSSPRGARRGKLACWAAAAASRRRGALLLAPLLYLALMLVMVGRWEWYLEPPVPVRVGVAILMRAPPPGSGYRSPRVFHELWPFMQADVNHSSAVVTESPFLWTHVSFSLCAYHAVDDSMASKSNSKVETLFTKEIIESRFAISTCTAQYGRYIPE
ncbi:hypothetical protein GW17_00015688 [Ensete ventricosum]|nr:hypothetical protein GW17_00015688 [Ensete ventricosum]